MSLKIVRENVSAREMLLDWGLAEAELIDRRVSEPVPLLKKAIAREPLATDEEDALVRFVAEEWRAALIGYFLHHPTTWLEATLEPQDLEGLRLSRYFLQDPKHGGARTISELMASPGGPEYRIANYDPALERGHIILVGTDRDLPSLRMAEGTHRSCERMMRHRDGLQDGAAKIFVGICETARQWVPYQGDKPAPGVPPGLTWWVD